MTAKTSKANRKTQEYAMAMHEPGYATSTFAVYDMLERKATEYGTSTIHVFGTPIEPYWPGSCFYIIAKGSMSRVAAFQLLLPYMLAWQEREQKEPGRGILALKGTPLGACVGEPSGSEQQPTNENAPRSA